MNQKTIRTLEFNKIVAILAGFAVSESGKEEILKITPDTDAAKILQMLDETDEGVMALVKNGNIPLSGFFDIRYVLKKARINSILTLRELVRVKDLLKIAGDVMKYLAEIKDLQTQMPNLSEMNSMLDKVSHLYKKIDQSIVSEEEVSDSASPELFRIRREINKKNHQIREKLNSMISSPAYQKYLQDNIITIRQDRFVIPVKQESRGSVPGIIHDQSSSGATLFIEPMAVVELNNGLRTLYLQEDKEIEKILAELTVRVAENTDSLQTDFEILLKLDIIFAKSKYALDLGCNRPKISENKILDLKQCRHPLIDRSKVVPSDIRLGRDFNALIITGPNTGGKTVALKTAGLMCLMAQSGMFIPVKDGSEICIFKSIFADIGDEQSIEQSLSTFSSHMTNIVGIIQKVEEGSLILLDELGAGTDPTEGAALAMAILDYLHRKGAYTMVTTHYSELKQYALSTPGMENASVEFDVNTLSPTYKLSIGVPGKSNAFEISRRLGLKEEVITEAKEYLSEEKIRFEDVIKEIEDNRKKISEELKTAAQIRLDNEILMSNIEKLKQEADLYKEKAKLEAAEESLKIIRDAKEEAGLIIKEMQQIRESRPKDSFRDLEILRKELKEKEDRISDKYKRVATISQKSEKPFKKGDHVLVKSLNQKGFIIQEPGEDGMAMVEIGIMKMKMNISDMIHKEPDKKAVNRFSRKSVNSKATSIKSSIDLRGMNAEEVVMDLEKYIDDAYLANLKQVTIVHGKGTGVLRKAVHQLLKRNGHVEAYRFGEFNEGGDGATIVTIK
ncbi:MAG: endonuclease MutS2 [Eubacteriaceae bacterium]|nr:endonuclease MutS2 [Eubacteriaceae bacterium]